MTAAAPTWPWWLGALWLAAVVVLYRVAAGRALGVSGFLARMSGMRDEIANRRAERRVGPDLQAALRAATLDELRAAGRQADPAEETPPLVREAAAPRVPWQASLTVLAALTAGGLLARLAPSGSHFDVDAALAGLCRAGWRGAIVLFIGGLLVGFGARMAGGCTSGHGLSGCGSRDRASIAATACFFATAVAVALFLES